MQSLVVWTRNTHVSNSLKEEKYMTIKSKMVSYGLVEIQDAGATSPRYRIYVNGSLKEYSDDLNTIIRIFDSKYY